jgi:hypothetical protein
MTCCPSKKMANTGGEAYGCGGREVGIQVPVRFRWGGGIQVGKCRWGVLFFIKRSLP